MNKLKRFGNPPFHRVAALSRLANPGFGIDDTARQQAAPGSEGSDYAAAPHFR
jgi:hypothetical protein